MPDTYILICSRRAPLSLFPAVSQRLVGRHQLAARQFLPTGFLSDPLGIFPTGFSRLPVGMFPSAGFLLLVTRS